jgi:thymidylate synthase
MRFNKFEQDYRMLLAEVWGTGIEQETRTSMNAKVLFDRNLSIDLRDGFPIVTAKKIFFHKAYHEYIWMRDGMITTEYLNKHGIHWWDKYSDENNSLGRTYGYQLRNYNGDFDQLMFAANEIKMGSRRAHITMWNPSDLGHTPLPCCYTSFTFVRIGDKLNMSMNFRSSDLFLGLPYDICVGALMLIEMAKFCELEPVKLAIKIDNAHIYMNHEKPLMQYLEFEIHRLPTYLNNGIIGDYIHGPYIKADMNE